MKMVIRFNKKKAFFFLGLIFFVLSGYLYLVWGKTTERVLLVVTVIFWIKEFTAVSGGMKKSIRNYIHYAFIFCMLIDSVIYLKTMPGIYALGMFYVWYVANRFLPMILRTSRYPVYEWIYKCAILTSMIIIVSSSITNPMQTINYSGIFKNPNGFGNFAASLSGIIFPLLLYSFLYEKKRNLVFFVGLLLVVGCGFCIIISSSRAAVATYLGQLACVLVIIFMKSVVSKLTRKLFKRIVIAVFIIFLFVAYIYLFTDLPAIINKSIIEKFSTLAHSEAGVLNNRAAMWSKIWENRGLFSDGEKLEEAAHNVYIGLVDMFGKLAGILYLVYILCVTCKAFARALKKDTYKYKYLPLFTSVSFLIVSMFENFLLTNSMILMYLAMPIIDMDVNDL
jgi:hypothetical protein